MTRSRAVALGQRVRGKRGLPDALLFLVFGRELEAADHAGIDDHGLSSGHINRSSAGPVQGTYQDDSGVDNQAGSGGGDVEIEITVAAGGDLGLGRGHVIAAFVLVETPYLAAYLSGLHPNRGGLRSE